MFDHVHGREAPPPADVDYAFYERHDLTSAREANVESELRRRAPDLRFDAKNQARVHLWYERRFGFPIPPYRSVEHAVSTWPETATSVACRLRPDDAIEVVAPLGLGDLSPAACGGTRRSSARSPPGSASNAGPTCAGAGRASRSSSDRRRRREDRAH